MKNHSLEACQALDAQDELRVLKDDFYCPEGVIYLDGNSLGPLPKAAVKRVQEVVQREWGQGLVRSWNDADWFTLPQRLGDKISRLVGADLGQVVVTDSTSINLYKVLSAALSIVKEDSSNRRVVVSERSNFPTDLYIAESLCRERGFEMRLIEANEISAALQADVAVLLLTHVNYRTGAMHDMAQVNSVAHQAGTLTVWDLAHSAGAVPVSLNEAGADFAIGCSYKYLNGGPGAPAFVWVNPRHADRFWQPLAGWWGHDRPFAFTPGYKPAPGIGRYLCGTQPILSLSALECGLDIFEKAEALGGMRALRQKSLALTDLFIELVEQRCASYGVRLATPLAHENRGSQVSLTVELLEMEPMTKAYSIVQALIARGVIGDFRAGDSGRHQDIMRFGFTPLYLGFADVWHAVEHLHQVLQSGAWLAPVFSQKQSVT